MVIGRRIHVRSTKYDGSFHWEFDTWLVLQDGPLLVTQDFAGQVMRNSNGRWTSPNDTRNYFWTDRWYNVMRFQRPHGGPLVEWYCNVTTPAEFDGESLHYVDLDLDVRIPWQGEPRVVDEDEFLENSERMGDPPEVIEQARRAVDELLSLARAGQSPFDHTMSTTESEPQPR